MEQVQALLIDTTGIQKYIFATNKLKANIGASYIIANIFTNETMQDSLKEVLRFKPDLEDWKTNQSILIFEPNQKFEVGYIGGGNALFFFSEDTEDKAHDLAKDFVKIWTKKLLAEYPGVNVAVAYQKLEAKKALTDSELYQNFRKSMMQELGKNKSQYTPVNQFLNFGINAPCKYTDLPSNIYYEDKSDKEKSNDDLKKSDFVSLNAFKKLDISKKANNELVENLKPLLGNSYTFETNQEKLGQKKDKKNYIAVSHIDGNGIGNLFNECPSLLGTRGTRKLSIDLEKNIQKSFEDLTEELVGLTLEQYSKDLNYPQDDKGNFILPIPLPIRPIVMSGDDITFVSEGRLGIYLTKRWIEILKSKPVLENQKVSYCAGIAIVNSNFPMKRAYDLAENACKSAKDKSRSYEEKEEQNWLDFHLQYGGYGGSLEEIRQQFIAPGGDLFSRPYQIGGSKLEFSLEQLIADTRELKNIPTSIQHELREVLWKNEEEQKGFVLFNETRTGKSKIPFNKFKLNKEYPEKSLFHTTKNTHYLDMIELAEFYPWFLEEGNTEK